jgi:hypothetical protein
LRGALVQLLAELRLRLARRVLGGVLCLARDLGSCGLRAALIASLYSRAQRRLICVLGHSVLPLLRYRGDQVG